MARNSSAFRILVKRSGHTLREAATGAGVALWRVAWHSAGYRRMSDDEEARMAAFLGVPREQIPFTASRAEQATGAQVPA